MTVSTADFKEKICPFVSEKSHIFATGHPAHRKVVFTLPQCCKAISDAPTAMPRPAETTPPARGWAQTAARYGNCPATIVHKPKGDSIAIGSKNAKKMATKRTDLTQLAHNQQVAETAQNWRIREPADAGWLKRQFSKVFCKNITKCRCPEKTSETSRVEATYYCAAARPCVLHDCQLDCPCKERITKPLIMDYALLSGRMIKIRI